MTTASIPRHARPPAVRRRSRLAFAWGLVRLAAFIVFRPSAPLPSGWLNVRVPDAPRGMRLALLDQAAAAYRTTVAKRFGCVAAVRHFGPVTVEAHVKDEDYSAQLAGMAGSGAVA